MTRWHKEQGKLALVFHKDHNFPHYLRIGKL